MSCVRSSLDAFLQLLLSFHAFPLLSALCGRRQRMSSPFFFLIHFTSSFYAPSLFCFNSKYFPIFCFLSSLNLASHPPHTTCLATPSLHSPYTQLHPIILILHPFYTLPALCPSSHTLLTLPASAHILPDLSCARLRFPTSFCAVKLISKMMIAKRRVCASIFNWSEAFVASGCVFALRRQTN